MLTLAFDTATDCLSLALGGPGWCEQLQLSAGREHLELLLPAAHQLLERHGYTARDLSSLVVGVGPGAFSGLRVGIASARALAQTLKLPLTGVSTLYALAQTLAEAAGGAELALLPMIDAKRGQVFARLYRSDGAEAQPASEILCLNPEALIEALPSLTRQRVLTAGNGVLAYCSMFAAAPQLEILAVDDPRHLVQASHYLKFGSLAGGYQAQKLLEVKPVYMREPDADKTVLSRKREPWL